MTFRMPLFLSMLLHCLTASAAAITPPPAVADIAATYAAYDLDGDGIDEINSIMLMDFEPATPLGSVSRRYGRRP